MYCIVKGCKEITKREINFFSGKYGVCDIHRNEAVKLVRNCTIEITELIHQMEDDLFNIQLEKKANDT